MNTMGHAGALRGVGEGNRTGGDLGSKSWRERTTEAIARETRIFGVRVWPGRFTADDRRAWRSFDTCAVGEYARAYGLDPMELNAVGGFSLKFRFVMDGLIVWGGPRKADRLLDEIEDAALALKRGKPC